MNYYKNNLEYLDKLSEVIDLQRSILYFQEHNQNMIIKDIESNSEKNDLAKIGEADMLRVKDIPYGRNKVRSWLNNMGYAYRENDRNYAKEKYINE